MNQNQELKKRRTRQFRIGETLFPLDNMFWEKFIIKSVKKRSRAIKNSDKKIAVFVYVIQCFPKDSKLFSQTEMEVCEEIFKNTIIPKNDKSFIKEKSKYSQQYEQA